MFVALEVSGVETMVASSNHKSSSHETKEGVCEEKRTINGTRTKAAHHATSHRVSSNNRIGVGSEHKGIRTVVLRGFYIEVIAKVKESS